VIAIKVLSLFDGISSGQIALERAEIPIDSYYGSEIDKHAIKVTQHNYPSTNHLGDVTNWKAWELPNIDLLIGGSPCTGFSVSGKMLNFQDPQSKLFFEYAAILKVTKPRYFLLENVKMKQWCQDVISEYLGVEPIEINSSLLSAQNRVRMYWTNIPNVTIPEDKEINLSDILESDHTYNPAAIRGRPIEGKNVQCLEVKKTNTNKSNCLTTVEKDNVLTPLSPGRYPDVFNKKLPYRNYTLKEYCRLQTVPEDYFDNIVSENQAKRMLGNGWNVDTISHILSFIKLDK
jgi:DNA (cytosine-5)-methyltransferase 3A